MGVTTRRMSRTFAVETAGDGSHLGRSSTAALNTRDLPSSSQVRARLTSGGFMKNVKAAVLGLALVVAAGGVAAGQNPRGATVTPKERRELRRDHREIRSDKREVNSDTREIRSDRREVRQDLKSGEKGEARRDERELRGDIRDRRGDARDLKGDKRDLRQDRRQA